jgi:HK97 family phage prohead protease
MKDTTATSNQQPATKLISRNLPEPIIIRSDDGDEDEKKRYIEGYAIIFNQRSKLIREWGETFYEVIEPTAPDNVLRDAGINVIATVDHDRQKMLGRTKSGTLQLIKEERGLKYRIELPDTTLGNDMAEMIARGDYFESSFIFTIAEKGYRYDRSGDIPIRYISDFERMYDVAIVIDGAYANTAVTLRSQEFETVTPDDICPPSFSKGDERSGGGCDILHKQLELLKKKY